MKFRFSHIGLVLSIMAAVVSGCALVDENMSDCESDHQLNYELRLVTNMKTEIQTQLSMAADVAVSTALEAQLKNIFRDHANDVDLSFYDVFTDSVRLHHESHIMDATESSYTLYIPVRKYMHLALANVAENPEVILEQDEKCHTARLSQVVRDTLESHRTGLFTARLGMDIKEGEDQEFNVHLYMANCASALVLDTLGSGIKDIKVYASGFANAFSIADSVYRFNYTPVIKPEKVSAGDTPGTPLCYTTVSFPSKDVTGTKATVETDDPFVSDVATEALWKYRIYTTLGDGSVTETILGVKMPLRPGQVKVIKGLVSNDGSCVPTAPYVGASVTLNWNEMPGWEVDF
ncbi:MAG: hypothetical protein J5675_04395 [Bacteroidales bacterium]|nr:hypothetical protein [Bacteroidales bacterium]